MLHLSDLIQELPEFRFLQNPSGNPWITGIQTDVRLLEPGHIFVALKTDRFDTHKTLPDVVSKQPAAIVVEDKQALQLTPKKLPVIWVPKSRQALAFLAQVFWGHPSARLFCTGVTGTNGKTSTTTMIEFLLTRAGVATAKIGTLGAFLNGQHLPLNNTTPGALELAALLKRCVDAKIKAVTMEVSSHSLDQFRVDGVHFDSVCFLNLTRDHLDYHGTMENYFSAKARLFSEVLYQSKKSPKWAAIHFDSPWAWKIKVDSGASVITFGPGTGHDVGYQVLEESLNGSEFQLTVGGKTWVGRLPILGSFQVGNFVGALCSLIPKGLDITQAIQWIEKFPGVPGRMEKVLEWSHGHVFIDYAHTPDALENSLKTLARYCRQESKSRLGVVFGCGGDRDQGKRPLMGQVASRWADWIVLTSDNPRSEDPQKIINEIATGITEPSKVIAQITDRKDAIFKALNQLGPKDVVLIAGKGHEDYQEIRGVKYPFSDKGVVLEARKGFDE